MTHANSTFRLRLSAIAALACGAAFFASQSFAADYTYNSDKPDAKQIVGAELNKTLGAAPKKEGVKIGVVLKSLTNQYWQGIAKGVEAAAKDLDVEVTVQAANSEADPTQQLTIAQTMIGRNFDAYVLSPVSVSNLTPAVRELQSRNIPIANADDARIAATVYIGPNHELNGVVAADYMAEHLPDGGEVAQIEGQAGSSAAILRIKGFKEGIAKHGNLKLVASVPGNWDGTQAYNATQTILRKNPEIKAIYANNDTMAVGVAKAVTDMGLTGKIIVIGTDGIPAALDGIKNGTITATVTPLPYYQGYWSVESLVRLLGGQPVPDWVVAPAQLITKDNMTEFFDDKYDVKEGLYNK